MVFPLHPGVCLVGTEDRQQMTRVWGAQSGPVPSTEMRSERLLRRAPFPSLTCLTRFAKGLLAPHLIGIL